ncbi:hypothetical protein [Lacunisphaera limnophila]|uniref:hypothetical protein n=1 Tax=Lacunisphaera limnophila TaxID=1838286 RepID=UPI0009F72962|nr:hypothetical protein [Lacunisphaera limnophila]
MPLAPTDICRLEKSVWSEADFEKMGWHDVVVHALAFDTERHELLLDIDYIFAWVDPLPPSRYFSYWLSPSTLVFHDAWDLKFDYDSAFGLQLGGIVRREARVRPHPHPEGKKEEWHWNLEGNEGELMFWATGYSQFTRHLPMHHTGQSWSLSERGGVSFEKPKIPKPPNQPLQPTAPSRRG